MYVSTPNFVGLFLSYTRGWKKLHRCFKKDPETFFPWTHYASLSQWKLRHSGYYPKDKIPQRLNLKRSGVLKKNWDSSPFFPCHSQQPPWSYMILCLCESTIEIIAFVFLPFKHIAISSADTEMPPFPFHQGFSVRKFLFRFVHNKTNHAEKWWS